MENALKLVAKYTRPFTAAFTLRRLLCMLNSVWYIVVRRLFCTERFTTLWKYGMDIVIDDERERTFLGICLGMPHASEEILLLDWRIENKNWWSWLYLVNKMFIKMKIIQKCYHWQKYIYNKSTHSQSFRFLCLFVGFASPILAKVHLRIIISSIKIFASTRPIQ